jgi:hypothetical protein
MAKNGHTFIDILKLDIEGSEFDVLDSIFKEYKGRPLPFGQLQLEVHVYLANKSFADILHWWERLEEAGLRPFWTEVRGNFDSMWMVYSCLFFMFSLTFLMPTPIALHPAFPNGRSSTFAGATSWFNNLIISEAQVPQSPTS